jgi:hypothetical protein
VRAMRARLVSAGSLLAVFQGGSYIAFGLWSLVARRSYRRIHRLDSDDWVLNAHGMWLVLVGSVLAAGGLGRPSDRAELRLLALGAALGLAANDAISAATGELPSIYYSDLAYEMVLAILWPVAWRLDRTRLA